MNYYSILNVLMNILTITTNYYFLLQHSPLIKKYLNKPSIQFLKNVTLNKNFISNVQTAIKTRESRKCLLKKIMNLITDQIFSLFSLYLNKYALFIKQ